MPRPCRGIVNLGDTKIIQTHNKKDNEYLGIELRK